MKSSTVLFAVFTGFMCGLLIGVDAREGPVTSTGALANSAHGRQQSSSGLCTAQLAQSSAQIKYLERQLALAQENAAQCREQMAPALKRWQEDRDELRRAQVLIEQLTTPDTPD